MKLQIKYKRLAHYDLGTRKLGYQPNMGIGSASSVVVDLGKSANGEAEATNKMAIPNAVNNLFLTGLPALQSLLSSSGSTAASTAPAITSTFTPSLTSPLTSSLITTPSLTSILTPPLAITSAVTPSVIASLPTVSPFAGTLGGALSKALKAPMDFFNIGGGAGSTGGAAAGSTGSSALGVAGTALGALGTAYGLYNLGAQIASAGDHRTALDMRLNLSRTIHTTSQGNQYTTLGNVGAGEERLARAQARSNRLGFGAATTGLGASIGGLVGSTALAGSVGGPLGTAIGAGVGLLGGLLGSIFGFGDNTAEVAREKASLQASVDMQNLLEESIARSKDVESEFNNKIAGAKYGKSSGGNMNKLGHYRYGKQLLQDPNGFFYGKPTSKVAPGEFMFDPDTLNGMSVSGPNVDKDVVLSSVSPGDNKVVFSNHGGFSDMARYLYGKGNYAGLATLAQEQNIYMKNRNKYKNGKLPGYINAKDYVPLGLSAMSGLNGIISNLGQLRRYENAGYTTPMYYVNNGPGEKAVNLLANLRFDVSPYINEARNLYSQANAQARRNVGLGMGGRVLLQQDNFNKALAQAAKLYTTAEEENYNRNVRLADKMFSLGTLNQLLRMNALLNFFKIQQQQNAAKENGIAQYTKNIHDAFGGMIGDAIKYLNYMDARNIQNRELAIYNLSVKNDKIKALLPFIIANGYNNKTGVGSLNTFDSVIEYGWRPDRW